MATCRTRKKSAAFLVVVALLAAPSPALSETGNYEGTETSQLYIGADGKQYCWHRWSSAAEAGGNPYYGSLTIVPLYTDAWYLEIYNPATGITQHRALWIQNVPNGSGGYNGVVYQWNGSTYTDKTIVAANNTGTFTYGNSDMTYSWIQAYMTSQYGAERDFSDNNCEPGNQFPPPPPDNDGDGIPDATDPDDDNDGEPDTTDPFPLDGTKDSTNTDTDGDGLMDNVDPDDDNDGILDENDPDDHTSQNYADCDGDGEPNSVDTDDDNDGILDVNDPHMCGYDSDCDHDGIADSVDTDDDNDGCPDQYDPQDCNPAYKCDCDGDGINDNEDPDDDNDGCVDEKDPATCNPNVACSSSYPGLCPGSAKFREALDDAKEAWSWLKLDLSAWTGDTESNVMWNFEIDIPGGHHFQYYITPMPSESHWAWQGLSNIRFVIRNLLYVVVSITWINAVIRQLRML